MTAGGDDCIDPTGEKQGEKVPWALVATHLPGRSAGECRAQWEAMRAEQERGQERA